MLYKRMLEPPCQSFFLFGARGTGKSTWARENFPDAYRIDLLDEGRYQMYLGNPSLVAGELNTRSPGEWVVLDEVQRLPGILNEAHRFIEERGLRFVLLGSSARKLKTQGTNLLAGRAVRRTMYPFVPGELGPDFDLEEVLRFGSIPLVCGSPDKADTLLAYVQMYLREEIRAEAIVRNLPGFTRFLPVAALFHARTVNTSAIARDSGTARTTVEGYLTILEDTLLAFRVPAFEARMRARERKHPKLYWIDPGLVRAVKRQLHDVSQEEMGALFEGWIAVLLRTYMETRGLFESMSYWSGGSTEVDFLLERQGGVIAVEAKAGSTYQTGLLRGLRALAALPNLEKRVLVYQGERPLRTSDGIEVWPVSAFLDWLESGAL